ncbi:MAG: M48 family metalloprotease [bacterium]|nr:M48 family metalloprotease [bacterium]
MSPPPIHAFAIALFLLALVPAASPAEEEGEKKRRTPTVLLSEYDDKDIGKEASKDVAAQIGLIDNDELTAYVNAIGSKLLRSIPRRSFDYKFRVVDQVEPNAFALPGGFIFVSRGLLALANDEDELACVLGHEITHVTKRHAAAQQGVQRGQFPLLGPWIRAGRMAAYSRDLEYSADRGGQILCAAAGYDPRGMATFLDSLMQSEKLTHGYSRNASFLDSHPSSGQRSTIARVQASEMRWQRDASIGDPRESLLRRTEGLSVGQRPESGMFLGNVFMHPDLDFKLRFPARWKKANSNSTVGAQAPRGDAFVFLTGDVPPGDPREVAEAWLAQGRAEGARLQDSGPMRVGHAQAWRLDLTMLSPQYVRSHVTFVPHDGSTFRITGAGISEKGLKSTMATTRSFRRLTEEDRAVLKATRLRLVEAKEGEDLATLGKRSNNAWDPYTTSVNNAISASHVFAGGELVKIAREEAYTPRPKKTESTE